MSEYTGVANQLEFMQEFNNSLDLLHKEFLDTSKSPVKYASKRDKLDVKVHQAFIDATKTLVKLHGKNEIDDYTALNASLALHDNHTSAYNTSFRIVEPDLPEKIQSITPDTPILIGPSYNSLPRVYVATDRPSVVIERGYNLKLPDATISIPSAYYYHKNPGQLDSDISGKEAVIFHRFPGASVPLTVGKEAIQDILDEQKIATPNEDRSINLAKSYMQIRAFAMIADILIALGHDINRDHITELDKKGARYEQMFGKLRMQ